MQPTNQPGWFLRVFVPRSQAVTKRLVSAVQSCAGFKYGFRIRGLRVRKRQSNNLEGSIEFLFHGPRPSPRPAVRSMGASMRSGRSTC